MRVKVCYACVHVTDTFRHQNRPKQWGGDTHPHPTPLSAFGVSILAPSALDLGAFGASCPPNEMSGSATAS